MTRLSRFFRAARRWIIGRRFGEAVERHEQAASRLDAAVREVLRR